MKAEMTQKSDEQQIRDVINSQLAALSAKDVDGAINAYGKGGSMFTLAPPLRSQNDSKESASAAVQKWFDTWTTGPNYESRDLQTWVSGDLALASSLRKMTGEQNGKPIDMWFRKSLGFQRIDGEWKIIHDHESVPFYMDGSMKAAVELTPEN